MFSTEIFSGQYINKNKVYTSTSTAWYDMVNFVKSQNNDYIFSNNNIDDIQYDLSHRTYSYIFIWFFC